MRIGSTSVHRHEQRHDDAGFLAGIVVADDERDVLEAAEEFDRLAAKGDRAPLLRIVTKDGFDDLRGERRKQPRLQLPGKDVGLRIAAPGLRVSVVIVGIGHAQNVVRVERIATKSRADGAIYQILRCHGCSDKSDGCHEACLDHGHFPLTFLTNGLTTLHRGVPRFSRSLSDSATR
jgi:hypothetical protein